MKKTLSVIICVAFCVCMLCGCSSVVTTPLYKIYKANGYEKGDIVATVQNSNGDAAKANFISYAFTSDEGTYKDAKNNDVTKMNDNPDYIVECMSPSGKAAKNVYVWMSDNHMQNGDSDWYKGRMFFLTQDSENSSESGTVYITARKDCAMFKTLINGTFSSSSNSLL